jgi:hypothetical protein
MTYASILNGRLLAVFTAITLATSTGGCLTSQNHSKIPALLLKAKGLNFNKEQKEFVGQLLHELNDYESK